MLAKFAVAAAAAALAGDAVLIGEQGFKGETGRERYDFCGEHRAGRIGDWSRVRELADFGDRTVDGFVTWRDSTLLAFVRFLGFGNGCAGSAVFSLSV